MRRSVIVAVALSFASPLGAEPGDSSADSILNSAGLADLTDAQRVAARSLVRRLVLQSVGSRTLVESAENYFENDGYKPVHLSAATANGKDYLIATSYGYSYATADVPLMLNTLMFTEGDYFAKPNALGGISEFIDRSGRRQSLFLAKWFKLR